MKKLSDFAHVTECDDKSGKTCPTCLSDHLSEDDIKPDGLCEACTECTECDICHEWKLPQDMGNELICCDCIEEIESRRNEQETFENSHGYGVL